MASIRWADIEAECGGYREGFVAIFRKYEGQATDERTAQGHVVKVTRTSFADHMGINPSTFHRWVKATDLGVPARSDSEARGRDLRMEEAQRVARHHPEKLVEAIAELPEEHQNEIVRAVRMRQVNPEADHSPAHRKAVEAAVHEQFDPAIRKLGEMVAAGIADLLAEAADELEEAVEKGIDLSDQLPAIAEQVDRLALTVARLQYLAEAQR